MSDGDGIKVQREAKLQINVSQSASTKTENSADASKKTEPPIRQRPRRNKKEELSSELKACENVLSELFSKPHSSFAYIFYYPVKGLPDYGKLIKEPMDMTTIKKKMEDRQYSSVSDFKKDVMVMIKNCRVYNDEEEILEMADTFENVFLARMKEVETCFPDIIAPQDANPKLDEKMIEAVENANDPEGVLGAMFAKARDKIYRGAAREAVKRIAYGLLQDDVEMNEDVKIENIIVLSDVLKAAALTHMSCYIFRQYKAAVDELDPERNQTGFKNTEKEVATKAAPAEAVPAHVTKSFVSGLDHYEKNIKEYPVTFGKIKAVYESERDEVEEDMINFETLKINLAYVRGSSKKKFKINEELLFFLRCLEANGLGRVYFGRLPDEKKSIVFDKQTYAKIRFQPISEEDDLTDTAHEILTMIGEHFEDFSPFK